MWKADILCGGCCDSISNATFYSHVMLSFIVMNKEECALLMFSFNLLAYELPFDDVTHLFWLFLLFHFVVFLTKIWQLTKQSKINQLKLKLEHFFLFENKGNTVACPIVSVFYRLHQVCNIRSVIVKLLLGKSHFFNLKHKLLLFDSSFSPIALRLCCGDCVRCHSHKLKNQFLGMHRSVVL